MLVSTRNKLKNFFRTFISLSYWFKGFCLGFVIWQTMKCLTKYIAKPTGSDISMKKSTDLAFPAISVCGSFGKFDYGMEGFNETYLQNVCGISYEQYTIHGQWSNSNCSDPKELFESVVFKPEDIIESILFIYWTEPGETSYRIHEFKDWYLYDDAMYGRCISLSLSHVNSQYGIQKIDLQLLVNSTIHIHTPGMFSKGSKQLSSKNNVELGKFYDLHVHYEVYELLDYGGAFCNNDKTYQLDTCNYNGTEKTSLEIVGCTTPFGPNKTKICTDILALKASDIYLQYMFSFAKENYEGCYYPCSYFIVTTKQDLVFDAPPNLSKVSLSFEQLIQETKSYYTYSELSLIAEIGGYVGLFLGISVNQMPYLLDIFGAFLARMRSLFLLKF